MVSVMKLLSCRESRLLSHAVVNVVLQIFRSKLLWQTPISCKSQTPLKRSEDCIIWIGLKPVKYFELLTLGEVSITKSFKMGVE